MEKIKKVDGLEPVEYEFYEEYDDFDANGDPVILKKLVVILTQEQIQATIDKANARLELITSLESGDTTNALPLNKPVIIKPIK